MSDVTVGETADETVEVEEGQKATQLPDPVGYKLLCAIPEIEKVTKGGIIKADVTIGYEEVLANVLFVLKIGPDAYQDKSKFPSGPWCKVGDFVLVPRNSGARVKIHGKEFRVINDDTVTAVVQDPRGIGLG